VGNAAGYNNTGGNNDAFGYHALYTNVGSLGNVAIGNSAMKYQNSNSTDSYNTAVGQSAMGQSGYAHAHHCIGIGYNAQMSADAADYQIVVGTNNSVAKGNSTGFINANGGANYAGNNSASWTTTSDRRIKKNITDNNIGLAEINQIQVRNFEYRLPEEVDKELPPSAAIDKEGIQVGVIAQEVMDILPDIVKQESTGCYSVDPDNLTWHLVNAVQELSAEVKELKEKVNGNN